MIGPPRNERTLHRIPHGNGTTKRPNFSAPPVNQTNHRNNQGQPAAPTPCAGRVSPVNPEIQLLVGGRRGPQRGPAAAAGRRGGARGRGRRGRQRRRQGRRPREWEPDDRRRRRRLLLPAGPRGEQRLVEAARLLLPLPRRGVQRGSQAAHNPFDGMPLPSWGPCCGPTPSSA